MLKDDVDDETWLREAEEAERRRRAAVAKLNELDSKPGAAGAAAAPGGGAAASSGGASGSGAYVPPNWKTQGRANSVQEDEAAITLGMCGFGAPGGPSLLGLKTPSEQSFLEFYKNWFVETHFPLMSGQLKSELVRRASQKGFFSGLSSQIKKWAMANTDVRLQADVWHEYFTQYAPPQYRIYGPVRVATVNLGSGAVPCLVTFYGIPEGEGHWILPPWSSHEADISAILDELDTRGGMSALMHSHATS
eukprot:TRINITY_DN4432_c0_g1_i1.p1 TRINITY_DN4432_c0_g1~~TRINITY_DN4432_c0_g1_i1.p1  ORF type:complete len:275 (+),score=56.18 TRINITY_DN4432_c0_g1_i1:79-825(+)